MESPLSLPLWNHLILITLFTLTCTFLLRSLLQLLFNPTAKPTNLPPGPQPWPLIGNLNLLIGPLPHQSLHELSRKHGPIMQLRLGSFPTVVASSAEAAKLFLRTHDHIFASRPKTAAGKHTTYNYSNITWAPYGPYWRQGRKIFLTELFSARRLESFEHIRVEEMRALVSRLFGLAGRPVVLKEQLSRFTLSVMSRIVLGKRYFRADGNGDEASKGSEEEDLMRLEELQEMLDELFLLNGVLNVGDWIPWLGFLDLQGYEKRMKALKKKFDRFHDHVLAEHRARRKAEGFVAKDMVDLLLDLAENSELEVKLSSDGVKGFIQDLIAGGTDTSATTVEWAMSELLKHPHLIEKATAELNQVVGNHRWVSEKDIPNLPFLTSIIKETMRKHPVAVLLAPHLALQDYHVAGFHVTKGTRVFVNAWSLGRDPAVWARPEEFLPERFLGREVDVKGQSFELLPFGSGRRMCPGYSLGLKMIGSSLANLLHGFDWKLAGGVRAQDLDMDELYGLTTVRKNPLVAIVEPRLPTRLYQNEQLSNE